MNSNCVQHNPVLVSDIVYGLKKTHMKQLLCAFKNILGNIFAFIYDTFKLLLNVSKFYLCWIIIHYIASHLYIKLCAPLTIYGFIISPFLTLTPHCQAIRWVLYNGAGVINNMWVIFGSWLCANVFLLKH